MYVIVDIETTGGNMKNGKITEIAIYRYDGQQVVDEFVSLVNPESYIPPFITSLTGITNEMVESAPPFYQIAKDIVEICKGAVFVAHNAAFDYNFIKEEFRNLGYSFEMPTICTVKLARQLLPGHASYSLGKICPELGIGNEARHRAAGDALATVKLFEILLDKNNGLINPEDPYKTFSADGLHHQMSVEQIKALPAQTGVYYMHNEQGELIYIGKSKNIRSRIITHLGNPRTKKGIEMKQNAADISCFITGSELVALLKESEEIKLEKPRYNRAQRRSKSKIGLYHYTDRNGYLRLTLKPNSGVDIPSATFDTIQEGRERLFQWIEEYELCQQLCGLYDGKHGCFQYQLKTCKGACVGEESDLNYNRRVQALLQKLSYGHSNLVILDKGRNDSEMAVVVVENGRYLGWGFIGEDACIESPEQFKDHITFCHDNGDTRSIISNYIRQKKYKKLIPY
ncbi:GIY-YIG nuclease family protein [Carboxylicivirga sediminis]|uniref:GIY-YIG nuclease family protein n=1 Tax=Carboxylicivirga sediminis TaxID=2006564 RepID=A0A941F762_9BACT|nr:exonuclease domain-containing protein [Carboxylicivirga sediminis]MBR8537847.1 GIY-YIG nuclease family protein [Carboxylicivirga sediminis]